MNDTPALAVFPFLLGRRMQVSFVVPDFHAALSFWTEKMGVGPFVVIDEAIRERQFIYRGRQTPIQGSIAFSYVGDTQIELIAQTNSAPSPYLEFLASGRQGIHHMAFWPEDAETAHRQLVHAGFEPVLVIQSETGDNKVRYYSGPEHLGLMIEIAPMTPERSAFYSALKRLADVWDGSDAVRTYATRAQFLASASREHRPK